MLTQRLGSSTQMDERFIHDFIRIVTQHPGSCDEVWLATRYGFPKMDTHRGMAEKLAGTAQRLRDAGMRVSLQISNTIGHGQYMSSEDCSGLVYDGSPVQNLVGPDGTVARYCFCWNDPFFREYVLEEVRAYAAAIKPHTVWIDDDLRATNHNPVWYGCFCPSCIARFNEKYGASFDRESLVQAINHGDPVHREHYVQFLRDGLYDFTYAVYSAIHEVSPDTYAGLQNAANGGYTGYGLAHIYDAMKAATGKNPKSRPGGGAYNDHNPEAMMGKADVLSFQNAMLPDYVTEIRPEIENLPDVHFGKTVAGTCYETSLYFATGATAMSYAMVMHDYEKMDWYGDCLGAFAAHREYWKALSAANEGTIRAGLTQALGRTIWKRRMSKEEGQFGWCGEPYRAVCDALRGLAIPLTYQKTKSPVYILHPAFVYGLTDGEIEELLTQPVLTDGEALMLLEKRGFGDRFSAKAVSVNTAQLWEGYNLDHPVNAHAKSLTCPTWGQSFFYTEGCALIDRNGGTEPLGWYNTSALNLEPLFPEQAEHPYGVADAVVTTSAGAKWAVFGHRPWNNVVSLARRDQLLRAADYISGNRVPAILETGAQAELFPREDKDGRIASVSVLNRTVGESGPLTIRIRRPALADGQTTVTFMAQYREAAALSFTLDGEDMIAVMPPLAPYTVGTVFVMNDRRNNYANRI